MVSSQQTYNGTEIEDTRLSPFCSCTTTGVCIINHTRRKKTEKTHKRGRYSAELTRLRKKGLFPIR